MKPEILDIFEVRDSIERQIVRLERAYAVHSEVEDYFEVKERRDKLPYCAEHITLLLNIVDELMVDMKAELKDTVGILSGLYAVRQGDGDD